jgi:hypothetical protein
MNHLLKGLLQEGPTAAKEGQTGRENRASLILSKAFHHKET